MNWNRQKILRARFILATCVLPLAAGCSLITSTNDAIVDSFHATTNSSSSTSHSFGGDQSKRNGQAVAFVQSQLPYIREDAARGSGEDLNTLAYLLGEKDPQAFAQWMQGHYRVLFTHLKQPRDLLTRIHAYRHAERTKRS